jgi:hypothetical protein
MREVEFLPDWYVGQRRHAERQRSAQVRVWAAALACGLCMSAAVGAVRLSQAGASSGANGTGTARANGGGAAHQPPRSALRRAARAMDALDQLTRPGLTISHVEARSNPSAAGDERATLEVRGVTRSAALLDAFVAAVRSDPCFAEVDVRREESASGANVNTAFRISLQVRPAARD